MTPAQARMLVFVASHGGPGVDLRPTIRIAGNVDRLTAQGLARRGLADVHGDLLTLTPSGVEESKRWPR